MLKELKSVRQNPGTRFRRWFADELFELIVWYDPDSQIFGFQLCYDKDKRGIEHALTWTRTADFSHDRVDDGEDSPLHNRAPILLPAGKFPYERLIRSFAERGAEIEPDITALVLRKLHEYAIRPSNTGQA